MQTVNPLFVLCMFSSGASMIFLLSSSSTFGIYVFFVGSSIKSASLSVEKSCFVLLYVPSILI